MNRTKVDHSSFVQTVLPQRRSWCCMNSAVHGLTSHRELVMFSLMYTWPITEVDFEDSQLKIVTKIVGHNSDKHFVQSIQMPLEESSINLAPHSFNIV